MMREKELHVALVSRELWTGMIRHAFRNLPPKTRRTAQSIIRTLHSRHVGITPVLAAQLAPLISEPTTAVTPEGPWAFTLKRLSEELAQGFGILLNAAPSYSLLRLALPIVETACRNIGKSFLFREDNLGAISAETYRRYSQTLTLEIRRMAEDKPGNMQTFWKERALTLASFSRRPENWSLDTPPIPETNPAAAALLTRLNPNLPPLDTKSESPSPITSRLKYRESRKHREAGFNGIRITRQPEDMEDILVSEFLNPPLLLADRLVNSGYLALKRKPKHEKLNDALIAAVLPYHSPDHFDTQFIKSCWFDFICRAGWLLCRYRLLNSRFHWTENTPLGHPRSCAFFLDHLPLPEVPDDPNPTPAFRRAFLTSLGWLPPFLDTRAHSQPLPKSGTETGNTGTTGGSGETDTLIKWALSAWKNQTAYGGKGMIGTEPPPAAFNGVHVPRLNVDTYAFVHIMLFLPDQNRDDSVPVQTRLSRLQKGLGIGTAPGRGVSITWVPRDPADAAKWSVDRPRVRDSRLLPTSDKLPWNDIARELELVWLRLVVEELRND